jgi:hypothetical protein
VTLSSKYPENKLDSLDSSHKSLKIRRNLSDNTYWTTLDNFTPPAGVLGVDQKTVSNDVRTEENSSNPDNTPKETEENSSNPPKATTPAVDVAAKIVKMISSLKKSAYRAY